MSKWIPTILPILSLIAAAVSPQVQAFIGTHPIWAITIASIQQIISHLLPSPVAASSPR